MSTLQNWVKINWNIIYQANINTMNSIKLKQSLTRLIDKIFVGPSNIPMTNKGNKGEEVFY